MTPLLLAATPENREASPIGLVVILCLVIAVVLLIRSMNKHLRKLPTTFPAERPDAVPAERSADPPERADPPRDETR